MKNTAKVSNKICQLSAHCDKNKNPYWAARVIVDGQNKKVLVKNEETEEETLKPVVADKFKTLKTLADAWRMAQEIDKAIPVLEKAAKLAKDGETYILLGNLYLFEDRLDEAIVAIQNGIKKGKLKKTSQAHLVLGQAYFELENFSDAKKYFRMAARDDDKVIKKTANSWIKYAENEWWIVRTYWFRYCSLNVWIFDLLIVRKRSNTGLGHAARCNLPISSTK